MLFLVEQGTERQTRRQFPSAGGPNWLRRLALSEVDMCQRFLRGVECLESSGMVGGGVQN